MHCTGNPATKIPYTVFALFDHPKWVPLNDQFVCWTPQPERTGQGTLTTQQKVQVLWTSGNFVIRVSDRLLNRKNTCKCLFKELMVQTKSELPYRELTFPTILGKGKSSTKYVWEGMHNSTHNWNLILPIQEIPVVGEKEQQLGLLNQIPGTQRW